MYERSYGDKYDGSMDVKDIAKLVRADIKSMIKAGGLPKGKYSVKIERFAGGQSLDIEIKEIDCQIVDLEYFLYPETNQWNHFYTKEAQAFETMLKAIVWQYNHDGSDSMTDYFDVNFYSNVRYDCDLRRQHEAKAKTTFDAKYNKPVFDNLGEAMLHFLQA